MSRWKRRCWLPIQPRSVSCFPARVPSIGIRLGSVDQIIEPWLSPLEQLHRTLASMLSCIPCLVMRRCTSWCIPDQAGLIARAMPSQRSPRDPQDLLEEVQLDSTAPTTKRQHLIEVCNVVDASSSQLLWAQVHNDVHAETAFDAVVQFLRTSRLPTMVTMDRDVRWAASAG